MKLLRKKRYPKTELQIKKRIFNEININLLILINFFIKFIFNFIKFDNKQRKKVGKNTFKLN